MTDLREQYASALTGSSLASNDIRETPLDRVAAVGLAGIENDLGGTLWRLKYAHDAKAYERALALLTKQIRRRHEPLHGVRRLCKVVLDEWLDDSCKACKGRGVSVAPGTPYGRHPCSACIGTGVQQVSAQRRMSLLKLSPESYPKWEQRFARVHQRIVMADDMAWQSVALRLERVMGRRVRPDGWLLALRKSLIDNPPSDRPAHNENTLPE